MSPFGMLKAVSKSIKINFPPFKAVQEKPEPQSESKEDKMRKITFDSPELKPLVEYFWHCASGQSNYGCQYSASIVTSKNNFTIDFSCGLSKCFGITFDFQSKKFTTYSDKPEIQAVLGERLNAPLDIVQIPNNLIKEGNSYFRGIKLRNDMSPLEILEAVGKSIRVSFPPFEG
jgi:hypothetical protein